MVKASCFRECRLPKPSSCLPLIELRISPLPGRSSQTTKVSSEPLHWTSKPLHFCRSQAYQQQIDRCRHIPCTCSFLIQGLCSVAAYHESGVAHHRLSSSIYLVCASHMSKIPKPCLETLLWYYLYQTNLLRSWLEYTFQPWLFLVRLSPLYPSQPAMDPSYYQMKILRFHMH